MRYKGFIDSVDFSEEDKPKAFPIKIRTFAFRREYSRKVKIFFIE